MDRISFVWMNRVNKKLGRLPIKDLYDHFVAFVEGGGRKVSAHFTHDTMLVMVFCALGLYNEDPSLQALNRDPHRVWRMSYTGAFSANIIAVLNRCDELGSQSSSLSYRVKLFLNERETPICPLEGCTWGEFQNKFKPFTDANLDFCSVSYEPEENEPSTNSAASKLTFRESF